MIIRYLLSIALGAVVTFGLFFLMQYLIATGERALQENGNANVINFVRVKPEEQVQVKERDLPKKPPPPDQPPPPPDLSQSQLDNPGSAFAVSGYEFGGGVDMGGINLGGTADGDVLPIVRIPPQYPRRAASAGIEGYVDFRFSISEAGTVFDPVVIDSRPSGVFDREARRALLKWKYKPKVENGKPVTRHGLEVRISFELEE